MSQNTDKSFTYEQVLNYLESKEIMPDRKPSLEPTKKALKELGIHKTFLRKKYNNDLSKITLIAGTNGKGSVASTLSFLIKNTKNSVGLYTSPHLSSYLERIKINDEEITKKDFADVFAQIYSVVEKFNLSHFEIITVMAAWYFFKTKNVDYAIFEVGLGGLWDATNAIPHAMNVVTPISLDHQAFLGSTVSEISKNKLAIVWSDSELKQSAKVVHDKFSNDIEANKTTVQQQTNSFWFEAPQFHYEMQKGMPPKYRIQSIWGAGDISLMGQRGAQNVNLALKAFEVLGFKPSEQINKLKNHQWPGRMNELIRKNGVPLFVSGDHNIQGVLSLKELLKDFDYNHLHIIAGVGANKNINDILLPMTEIERSSFYLTESPFMGLKLENYPKAYSELAVDKNNDPIKLIQSVYKKTDEGHMILVTGSLYLVGEVISRKKDI